MGLSRKEINKLTEKINIERARVMSGFDDITEDKYCLSTDDRQDEVDQAASDYARSQLLRFRNRNSFYLKKLSKALHKIAESEYGTCEDCDEDIKFERLYARPTAELCISCKDEAEREENGSFKGRQSKTLEKNSSMVSVV
jgi:DnaK suppressor protein